MLTCGKNKKRNPIEAMSDRLQFLQQRLITEIGETDWLTNDCDGLLWNSLALYGGVRLDLFQAEYSPGKWHRRPPPACWDGQDNGSKSTTSNDQLTGLLLALWHLQDIEAMNRLYDYGKANDWVMGEPYPEQIARVVLRPNGRYLLARMIQNISGVKKEELILPNIYLPVSKDFEYHLQSLGIYLSGELNNQINDQMLKRLRENIEKYPFDALFHAVLGLYEGQHTIRAMELLLDPNYVLPSYVRGDSIYEKIHKLFVIRIIQQGLA